MANLELTFLGTSSMVPTKERNVQGMYLEYKGEGILIDCGEGTQRQMAIAGINRGKVKKILISHWHGDHVLGLPGLLQTIGNIIDNPHLELYGPVNSKKMMNNMLNSCIFYNKVHLTVHEITPKKLTKFYENNDYELHAISLNHSVPCIGFKFVEKEQRKIDMAKAKKLGLKEGPDIGKLQSGKSITLKGKKIKPNDVSILKKGKSIAFILDTLLCNNGKILAKNADLLVSECVYAAGMEHKAKEYKHMTAPQVAQIAKIAKAKKLIITHFSQRYKNIAEVLGNAKTIFPNTEAAQDFMRVKI